MPRLTPVHYSALIKVFRKKGYSIKRHEGSHIVMNKPGASRPIIIPTYAEVGVSIIKANLRSADISHREYFELLADP
jgi:predicted RNA binding protein YcfA (HicA-like mRNA interferase family)